MKISLAHPFLLCLFALLQFATTNLAAQKTLQIALPDAEIWANKITKGDCDTYGLGDWRCTFNVTLDGAWLELHGSIMFSENANDYTTITGQYQQRIYVGALEKCRLCTVALDDETGSVSGPNIGARGFRWYNGQGLIRKASIRTDDFGCDEGRIGGTIRFLPVKIRVNCAFAATDR